MTYGRITNRLLALKGNWKQLCRILNCTEIYLWQELKRENANLVLNAEFLKPLNVFRLCRYYQKTKPEKFVLTKIVVHDIIHTLIFASAAGLIADSSPFTNKAAYASSSSKPRGKRHKKAGSNRGKRPDLGNYYFKSSWEANYARYLNYLILQKKITKWEYEVDKFDFHGIMAYIPDFKVWVNNRYIYVEVKGFMDSDSKKKLKLMRRLYPNEIVKIVGSKEYRKIRDTVGKSIKTWE